MRDDSPWLHFDFWLLGAVAVLTILGITMINSTIAGNIDMENASNRQTIFAVFGFIALILITSIDYHLWAAVNRSLYLTTVVVLAVLYVVGTAVLGSARWFQTTLVSIQPSEFAKVIIILVLAEFFAQNRDKIGEIKTILKSLFLTLFIVVWIILQPNLSTSIVILVIWFALLWASGLKLKHMLLFGAGALGLGAASFPFLHDYQRQRVLNFLFPDPTARHGANYNVQQALISIGSGGWAGQGYGHGTQVQLRFLKVRWSDFIFSAMAEEFGFIGLLIIIGLLMFIIYRCLRAAHKAPDTFGALICFGVATLLAFQALVNIGVNLNLMPATGLPLPFISYGGSSLFSLLICIGLVESVVSRAK
jgi:rod shape determining protein RodA